MSAWKRQAVDGFSGGCGQARENREGELHDLHAKIAQLTVERDFLARCRVSECSGLARQITSNIDCNIRTHGISDIVGAAGDRLSESAQGGRRYRQQKPVCVIISLPEAAARDDYRIAAVQYYIGLQTQTFLDLG